MLYKRLRFAYVFFSQTCSLRYRNFNSEQLSMFKFMHCGQILIIDLYVYFLKISKYLSHLVFPRAA